MENTNNRNDLPTNNQPIINPEPTPPTKDKTASTILIFGIIVGIILTASIVSAFYFYNLSKINSIKPVVKLTEQVNQPNYVTPTPSSQQTQFGTITWLSSPKKISTIPIKLTSDSLNLIIEESNFYEIAEFSDGSKLIDGFLQFDMPGGPSLVRFIESKGKYFYLTSGIEDYLRDAFVKDLVAAKPIDLILDGLNAPETINSNTLKFNKTYATSVFFNTLKNPQKLFDTDFGPIYQVNNPVSAISDVYTKQFYLKLKDTNVVLYQLSDQPGGENSFIKNIRWSDSTKNNTEFNQNIVTTCSAGGVGVPFIKTNSSLFASKKEIGRTPENKPLYQITDINSPLVKVLYRLYKDGRNYPDLPAIIKIEDFVTKINHFLWQDSQGDWQIFMSSDYSALAECGKPVIYLYPQKETQIKVQVGAQITQSDPIYPQGGWLVTAKPNGELTYQNQTYPYLFWEGLGNGLYPDYRDRGTVVAQKDLVSTLYQQLSKLGLNQKESADFMEFWQPKLPKTPYVRLTWLDTKDMDTLAPLAVTPRPDTSIRIFLEFQGLDKPIKLIPQTLSSPERQGFTLIEWGGLLLKGK